MYIHGSEVRAANASIAPSLVGRCALGRPWNALHRSIFVNTYEDASVRPSGYIIWSTSDPRVNYNTTMAEYKDFGPGFNITGRSAASNVTIEMTKKQYQPYSSLAKVFQFPFNGTFGNTAWIDQHPNAYV